MKFQKKVSVIIVNKDRKEDLRNCLNSVIQQDYKAIEIFVIDNDSRDGSSEMVESEFKKVILIKNCLDGK